MHIKRGHEEVKESIEEIVSRLYDDKLAPGLIRNVQYSLSQNNPVFGNILWEGFVVMDKNRVVGAVVAVVDPRLRISGNLVGILGFFECEDNVAAGSRLLLAAEEWLREKDADYIVGPMNFNTWNQYRFIIEAGEDSPFLFEPQHQPYYPGLWEAAGFTSKFRYYSGARSDFSTLLPYTEPAYEFAVNNGFTFRTFDVSRFTEEMQTIHALTIKVFECNIGFVPLSFEEYSYIYNPVIKLFDPKLVHFVEKDGQAIGFSYSIADRLFPEQKRVILKTIGLLPEWQRQHLGAALGYVQHAEMKRQGFEEIVYALIIEGNAVSKMEYPGARIMRRYALYEKKL